jgi:site-specific DNA-methyltransferase (adenine-specific)
MSWEEVTIGACRLIRGDASEVLPCLAADSFALGMTSPPYDQLRTYGGHAWDFAAIATALAACLCPGGVLVWVVNDSFVDGSETGSSFRQALYFTEQCRLNLHDTMIYQKANPGGARSSPHAYWQAYDFMFVLSRGRPRTFHPLQDRRNVRVGLEKAGGSRKNAHGILSPPRYVETQPYGRRTNIWTYPTDAHIDHPAVFPLALAQDHIRSWSNPTEGVIDPFMGSGTTGVAAVKLQRAFTGIEIEPRYFNLACKRIEEAYAQPSLFEPRSNGAAQALVPAQTTLFGESLGKEPV